MPQIQRTRVLRENQASESKINLNRGGTRSSKTYSLVQLAVVWLLSGKPSKQQHIWSICRKTLPSLKATAYRDFREIIGDLEYWGAIRQNLSSLEFTHNSHTIEFFSLDDQQKVRSRKRDHLHIVEANETDFETFTQLLIRTKLKAYLDWNPDDPFHWIREELEEKRAKLKGDVNLVVSTYLDNPHLTAGEIAEIEYLKEVDPELWAVFGTGEYGQLTDLVFKNIHLTAYPDDCDYQYLGIDFGWSPDPAACILVGKSGNNIYLKELVYETNLTNKSLADAINATGYGHLTGVADSSEPKSIFDLNAEGLEIWKAVKGADSIRNGLDLMRTYQIHIDPTSLNLLKEFRAYKWSIKKAGVPVDFMNHGIDACRYVISLYFNKHGGIRTSI